MMPPMQTTEPIGLSGVAGVLAPGRRGLASLAAREQLVSAPETLPELGFTHAHIADSTHDAGWLAASAVRAALNDAAIEPAAIDVLIWASALPENHVLPTTTAATSTMDALLGRFHYRGSWLQNELGL